MGPLSILVKKMPLFVNYANSKPLITMEIGLGIAI
jgi:hypothetical protein